MERALRDGSGKLVGLLDLSHEEWGALEADLLSAGFTLADIPGRVTWRAVMSMVTYARPGSAFYHMMETEETQWPRIEQLAAILVDSVNDLAWMYQCAHSENPPSRPQRLPRPGVQDVSADGSQHYGFDPIPATDFDEWWARGGG